MEQLSVSGSQLPYPRVLIYLGRNLFKPRDFGVSLFQSKFQRLAPGEEHSTESTQLRNDSLISGAIEHSTTFRYNDLPIEIRRMVMSQLFTSCRPEIGIQTAVIIGCHSLRCDNRCYHSKEALLDEGKHTSITFPEDFVTLFTSRKFFEEALPVFASHTTIDFANTEPAAILDSVSRSPILKEVLTRMFSYARQIQLREHNARSYPWCDHHTALDISSFTSKLRIIDICSNDELHWRSGVHDVDGEVVYGTYIATGVQANGTNARPHSVPLAEAVDSASKLQYISGLEAALQQYFFSSDRFQHAKALQLQVEKQGLSGRVFYWTTLVCLCTQQAKQLGPEYWLGQEKKIVSPFYPLFHFCLTHN